MNAKKKNKYIMRLDSKSVVKEVLYLYLYHIITTWTQQPQNTHNGTSHTTKPTKTDKSNEMQ